MQWRDVVRETDLSRQLCHELLDCSTLRPRCSKEMLCERLTSADSCATSSLTVPLCDSSFFTVINLSVFGFVSLDATHLFQYENIMTDVARCLSCRSEHFIQIDFIEIASYVSVYILKIIEWHWKFITTKHSCSLHELAMSFANSWVANFGPPRSFRVDKVWQKLPQQLLLVIELVNERLAWLEEAYIALQQRKDCVVKV